MGVMALFQLVGGPKKKGRGSLVMPTLLDLSQCITFFISFVFCFSFF